MHNLTKEDLIEYIRIRRAALQSLIDLGLHKEKTQTILEELYAIEDWFGEGGLIA